MLLDDAEDEDEDPDAVADDPELYLLLSDGEVMTVTEGDLDGLLIFTMSLSGVVVSDNGDGKRFKSAIRISLTIEIM